MRNPPITIVFASLFSICSCGGAVAPQQDGAVVVDMAPLADKAAGCASSFGSALTAGFGRLDGTVVAVVEPGNESCARPNGDHLVLQVRAGGEVYRMVVNVQSDRASTDPAVAWATKAGPLTGTPWSEGWHVPATLDYVTDLGLHTDAFTPLPMDALVTAVANTLTIGASVSVYAETSGGDSAHLVHYNDNKSDGAIVVDAATDPHYVVFRFADQQF